MRMLPILSAVIAVLLAIGLAPRTTAQAASSALSVGQSCGADGSANISFAWQGNNPNAIGQWVDLSLADNGWTGGTFLGSGSLSPLTATFTWDGLLPGRQHFVRVNQQLANGSWDPSPTFAFTSGCGSLAQATPPATQPQTMMSPSVNYPAMSQPSYPSAVYPAMNMYPSMGYSMGYPMMGGMMPYRGYMPMR